MTIELESIRGLLRTINNQFRYRTGEREREDHGQRTTCIHTAYTVIVYNVRSLNPDNRVLSQRTSTRDNCGIFSFCSMAIYVCSTLISLCHLCEFADDLILEPIESDPTKMTTLKRKAAQKRSTYRRASEFQIGAFNVCFFSSLRFIGCTLNSIAPLAQTSGSVRGTCNLERYANIACKIIRPSLLVYVIFFFICCNDRFFSLLQSALSFSVQSQLSMLHVYVFKPEYEQTSSPISNVIHTIFNDENRKKKLEPKCKAHDKVHGDGAGDR